MKTIKDLWHIAMELINLGIKNLKMMKRFDLRRNGTSKVVMPNAEVDYSGELKELMGNVAFEVVELQM